MQEEIVDDIHDHLILHLQESNDEEQFDEIMSSFISWRCFW